MWSYQWYGEGRIDSGRTSSGQNPTFNLCIKTFFSILESQVRCHCILYLLSFIVTMYWTKFLNNLYSNSHVFVCYIEGHFIILFFVSIIIGCHNCSYYAFLYSFCTVIIQLYDTFYLSPSCALDIAIELRISHSWYS